MKPSLMALIPALAAPLLPGCIGYLPPTSLEPISGKRITGHDASFITPGKTTRTEVTRTLGSGYSESPLVKALAYPWEAPAGNAFWVIAGGNAGTADNYKLTRWRALFVAFDSRGVVTKKEIVSLKKGRSLDQQLEKWAGWKPPAIQWPE